uniref:CCDC174 alpha/beta GRSR domain-containing protein n=1 Tax=Photinus pyralis TaxID=7054 RepID=A0A1Y1MAG5_PHOPY
MSTYEISKSSLLSLKAEILRKQEELNKTKLENQTKTAPTKKLTPLEVKNKGVEQRTVNDISEEDENLLKKSRSILEAKAKLYEKLMRRTNFTDEELEHNQRYLVRFHKKSRIPDLPPDLDDELDDKYPDSDEERHFSDEYEPPKNPEEDWVEYTDCLGRTRKCMKKDLAFVKSKDAELLAAVNKDENKVEQLSKAGGSVVEIHESGEPKLSNANELLSSDMRRELLRQQWEKEEDQLRKKDDIHYQDILFNEARTHGVGYYGFSKDEEERAKQQEALKNLRQETEQEQKKAQDLRELREKQLKARAKAARNRKRARMGLPPEEDEPEVVQPEEPPKSEVSEKPVENEKKDQEKEAARKNHVRPWDIGKKGVKEHYEYTQEEWVDKKRRERPKDFAPPSSYKNSFRRDPEIRENVEPDKKLYFSTKKNRSTYKEEKQPPMRPKPIVNECDESPESDSQLCEKEERRSNEDTRGKRAEFAPPPTYDYYGPSDAKKSKPSYSKGNLVESISAGLQFLREQAEKKGNSNKHDEDMFLI